jgi:diguanylate cyclase (GGDEF)-like protein/PAS domain S-box-containing protein
MFLKADLSLPNIPLNEELGVDARGKAKRTTLRRRVKITALALLISLLGLIVATGLFARQAQLVREATRQEMAIDGWQSQLQSVLTLLIDAETGQRGYMLTGKERYLAPYKLATREMPHTLQSLRAIAIPKVMLAGHLRDVQEQTQLKLSELAETVRLQREGDSSAARALVQTDRGQRYMEQLRTDIDAIGSALDEHRNSIRRRVLRGSVVTQQLAEVTATALVIVIFLAGLQIWLLMNAETQHTRVLTELTDVFDKTPDYVAQANWLGQMQYINPAALRALELPADFEVRGHTFTEFYTKETNKRWMSEIIPAVKRDGVWVGETAVVLKGHGVPVNHMVIGHRGALGRINRYSSIMRDISRDVAARQQLARQTATLNAIIEAIPAVVEVWDTDLRYRIVNKASERWRGMDRAAYIGRTIQEVLSAHEYERSLPWFRRSLAGETVVYEKDYPDAAEARHVRSTYMPLYLEDGTVGGVIGVAQDVTHQREENLRLTLLSERDALTGLMNRAGFETYLTRKISQGDGASLAVLYIDLDYFKPINDRYGHAAGDEVLRQFGSRLQSAVRPTDAVARLGGDEFGIVLAGLRRPEDASIVANKVVALARQPFTARDHALTIGASVGVAFGADEQGGWQDLVNRADTMAYEAKAAGRGRSALAVEGLTSTEHNTVSRRALKI